MKDYIITETEVDDILEILKKYKQLADKNINEYKIGKTEDLILIRDHLSIYNTLANYIQLKNDILQDKIDESLVKRSEEKVTPEVNDNEKPF